MEPLLNPVPVVPLVLNRFSFLIELKVVQLEAKNKDIRNDPDV